MAAKMSPLLAVEGQQQAMESQLIYCYILDEDWANASLFNSIFVKKYPNTQEAMTFSVVIKCKGSPLIARVRDMLLTDMNGGLQRILGLTYIRTGDHVQGEKYSPTGGHFGMVFAPQSAWWTVCALHFHVLTSAICLLRD